MREQILKDVSLRLYSGGCIAIMGPSGSGKSTTINLIPPLYDVTGVRWTLAALTLAKRRRWNKKEPTSAMNGPGASPRSAVGSFIMVAEAGLIRAEAVLEQVQL